MKAIIFDMDGVLVDSEIHWDQLEDSVFHDLIPAWTDEDKKNITGIAFADIHVYVQEKHGLDIGADELFARVHANARDVYENRVQLLPHVREILETVKHYRLALASSSHPDWIALVLNRFDLRKYFEVIVSQWDLKTPGKPAPDIYLHTAALLGLSPDACIVIEDSLHGVASAKGAGMACIGITNPKYNKGFDLDVDLVIQDFSELTLEKIKSLDKS